MQQVQVSSSSRENRIRAHQHRHYTENINEAKRNKQQICCGMSWLYNVMRFRWIKLCTQQRSMNLCHKYSVSPFRFLVLLFTHFFLHISPPLGLCRLSLSLIFPSLDFFSWRWSVSVCTQFAFVRNQFLMHKCRKVDLRHVLTSFLCSYTRTHAHITTQTYIYVYAYCISTLSLDDRIKIMIQQKKMPIINKAIVRV